MTTTTANKIEIRGTRVFEELVDAWSIGKRRFLMEGGTSSSKTFSALQFLPLLAKDAKESVLISVVSESLPHLKRGAIRDFFNVIGEPQDNNPCYSKTEFTYRRPNWPGVIEFFGADDDSKVRGPRRDVLFMNEGNNIPWETARGLDIRTSKFTIVDWNPVGEFWAHEYWIGEPENAYSHSTYLDAKAAGVLPEQVVRDIESYKDKDPNWWNIYGLGLIGKVEGLVYPHFEQIDSLPLGAVFYGLDYGYLVDPTVLTKHVIIGSNLYSQQMFYDTSGLTNGQIAQKMTLLGIQHEPVYADPDEPKSSDELREKGFAMMETVKGKGSVSFGIQRVNQYYQHWTKDSVECIKEQRNFRFVKDRQTGLFTDRTTHQFSHGMDGRRYAVASHSPVFAGGAKAVSYL